MRGWLTRAVALLVLLGVVLVISNTTYRKRKQQRAILDDRVAEYLSRNGRDFDRYVDVGVELRTVVADPDGETLIAGKPRLRVIKSESYGGIVDTRSGELVAPSRSPVIWYASGEQELIAVHEDSEPLGQLVDGSEGAGKTRTLAMWHYFRWLEHVGEKREGGQTAPTKKRLRMFLGELRQLFPRAWYRYVKSEDLIVLCDGTRIQLVSTHQRSGDEGSPIQGYNWSWCGRDEVQDQVAVHEDIESRGRAAKLVDGVIRYKQCATGTMKDSPAIRSLRAMMLSSGDWAHRRLLIVNSPFVDKDFIARKKRSMSDREFRRRMLAEDLPPELATYPAWDREKNTIHIHDGFLDVTPAELRVWATRVPLGMLGGHDPGTLWDVTLMLRAYSTPETRARAARLQEPEAPIWVVIDELSTERTTSEQHVAELVRRVRSQWRMNLLARDGKPSGDCPQFFVRADPYGNNDARPDKTCYTTFRNAGIRIEPAAYAANSNKPGRVPKEAGIELVNTLFCNAAEERRLFIAVDEQGQPCAPKLIEAIESSERDTDGKAETQKKDEYDVSHWPAALRYALWAVERPRLKRLAA